MFWLLGIALPNEKSRKLHEKIGFKKIAHFEEIGRKFNQWIDVGYWSINYKQLRIHCKKPMKLSLL